MPTSPPPAGALSADQWQTVTNIMLWNHAFGLSLEQTLPEIVRQVGQGAVNSFDFATWQQMWFSQAVWKNQGYDNPQISAMLQNQFPSMTLNPPAPPGDVLTADQRSAKANITGFLEQYGLGELAGFAWQEYLNDIPVEQIMLDIQGRPEYAARFPAMQALRKKGHAMSESDYIAYEKQVGSMMGAAGFPEDFFNEPLDFKALLEGEVSAQEVGQRIQDWLSFADTAPSANKDFLQQYYGIGVGDIAAYFINPEKALPLIEKQAHAALTGAAAQRTGFGNITAGQAEYVSGLVDPEQSAQGFTQLARQRELFGAMDSGENLINIQQQLEAMFGGNAQAQTTIETRAARRLAQFAGGGQFTTGATGLSGIGSAR